MECLIDDTIKKLEEELKKQKLKEEEKSKKEKRNSDGSTSTHGAHAFTFKDIEDSVRTARNTRRRKRYAVMPMI